MTKMWDEIHQQPAVLERCFSTNKKTIEELINEIHKRNISSIVIAARGSSNHAATYGKYIIEMNLGIPVALAAPSIFTIYGGELNLANSLVISISQSGQAADVIEVTKSANRQGAITTAITNSPGSPLANVAKFHLYCDAGSEQSVAATKTFTSQMYLLARLTAEWARDSHMKNELSYVPQKISDILETAGEIGKHTVRYRFMNECFVLARGVNYPIALEAALKIQETCYVRAKAFATSEFQHGPIAMVDKDLPVIILAPDGPSYPYMREITSRLKQKQVELIIISNLKDMLDSATCAFPIPQTNNDIISPFFNVVTAQIFACQLSVAKGLDPDKPRELSKVTITR